MVNTSNRVLILGSESALAKKIKNIFSLKNYDLVLHKRKKLNIDDKEKYQYIYGDITDDAFLSNFENILKKYQPNIYINCVTQYDNSPFLNISDETIKSIINVNVLYPTLVLKKVCNYFCKNKSGTIVNISSIAANYDSKGESIYSLSKSAMKKLHNCVRLEVLPESVRIINVSLGAFQSRITKERKNYENLPDPEEIAEIIFYLVQSKNFNTNEIELRRFEKTNT